MQLQTKGISHVALRTTDMARAHQFYTETLGFPIVIKTDELFLFSAGGTLIGIRDAHAQTPSGDRFNPFRVGLDHIALAVEESALEGLKAQLDGAGVHNNGIENDTLTGSKYISFYDPDGIAWELYYLPAR